MPSHKPGDAPKPPSREPGTLWGASRPSRKPGEDPGSLTDEEYVWSGGPDAVDAADANAQPEAAQPATANDGAQRLAGAS